MTSSTNEEAMKPDANGWLLIEGSELPDEEFLAAVEFHDFGGNVWWERHILLIDKFTGDIDNDYYLGWNIEDYSHWQRLPGLPVVGGKS